MLYSYIQLRLYFVAGLSSYWYKAFGRYGTPSGSESIEYTEGWRVRVRLAYYDTRELSDPSLYGQGLRALVWDERRRQAERLLQPRDRRLCVGAGLLAQGMLVKAGATDLTLAYGEHGKPYLARHPSIHFNLSHSGDYALCAVADRPVGVDIQEMVDYDEALARHCMCDDELAWLAGQGDKSRALTRLWVRKESYIKLTGEGLSRNPITLCVIDDCEHPLADGRVSFSEFEVPGCIICTCMHDDRKVALRRWDMTWKR